MGHNFLLKKNNNANRYYQEEEGNTATANNNTNTGKQQRHMRYMSLDNKLKERYLVLGDNDQIMDNSVCMICIHYTGWVPHQCNCSAASSTIMVKAAAVDVHMTDRQFAHGVTPHGSSFQTTPAQDTKKCSSP